MQTLAQFNATRWTVFPTKAEADEIAATLKDDPDHRYEVREDPKGTGKCIISAYDRESGDFVGNV
jgi:hypothetical protein